MTTYTTIKGQHYINGHWADGSTDSFESFDHAQAQDYISTLSFDDDFALKIFLKSRKNLKSFIADRDDVVAD